MRYAEMPTVDVETVVQAPVEVVWSLVTDINLPAKFSSEFQGAEWLDEGPAVGARFAGRNTHEAIGSWATTCVVTRSYPERVFEWVVGFPDHPSARWRFELEPGEDGTEVLLRHWCQIGPAPSGLTAAIEAMPDKEERIVARRLEEFRTNMKSTVTGIAVLAEAGAS